MKVSSLLLFRFRLLLLYRYIISTLLLLSAPLLFFFFFFFNDTATTEIYTLHIVGSVRCVQETEFLLYQLSMVVYWTCLLYTSDAADDMQCVDLGGRRIIKKKKKKGLQGNQ
eukprot:TRINITY_DN1231_c0_g1_i5.p2 TRINITY_DN1231_c0_g1~~TRINITY_DN1231_c0_g1_i5.p2  ORF type:complete len:112 (-),score=33.98 TRINITY_DN1231_c0_g1_i5:113-448(-)